MNRWYRKTLAKAIAVIAGIASCAVFVTSVSVMVGLSGSVSPAGIMQITETAYEDSNLFNIMTESMMIDALDSIRAKQIFETDGAYNPDKIIDIMDYNRYGTVVGENNSGISYRLEELVKWSEDYSDSSSSYVDNDVVVCEKPDGSYYYYYLADFLHQFETGALQMIFDEGEIETQESFLGCIETGVYLTSGYAKFRIVDRQGETMYTECWNFGRSLKEKYSPVGASSLLQILNERPDMNGKLMLIYGKMADVLSDMSNWYDIYQGGWDYLEEGNTNFSYMYITEKTQSVITNRANYGVYREVGKNIEELISGDHVKYMIISPKLKDFETNMTVSKPNEWDLVKAYTTEPRYESTLVVAVDTSYPVQDQFYQGHESYQKNIPVLKRAVIISCASAVLFFASVLWLILTAGRRAGDDELHLTTFDRMKTEVAAGLILGIEGVLLVVFSGGLHAGLLGSGLDYVAENGWDSGEKYTLNMSGEVYFSEMLMTFLYVLAAAAVLFVGGASLVRRIKGQTLWKNSILYAFCGFLRNVFEVRHYVASSCILIVIFLLIQWMAIFFEEGGLLLLALAADAGAIYLILRAVIAKSRVRRGVDEISSGKIQYQIPLGGLGRSDRELAGEINQIADGLNKALEEATRNERLKTDLITNVSHDIKTPLTSIINYVDILKRSDIQDEKIQGYLDILEEKAQRLKILTEDVVEASKVSSGNIVLECMDMDFRELIQQTEGELAEKFQMRNLTTVLSLPEEPVVIHVDGRRMWRVLENIFNNAAKYSMTGTRVYADLRQDGREAVFSLKNVSEQQLNIPADDLMERFIRGDLSRSTEGSGLGLSIAKSLVTMQGGELELYLDGDLFRVNIRFPLAKQM